MFDYVVGWQNLPCSLRAKLNFKEYQYDGCVGKETILVYSNIGHRRMLYDFDGLLVQCI